MSHRWTIGNGSDGMQRMEFSLVYLSVGAGQCSFSIVGARQNASNCSSVTIGPMTMDGEWAAIQLALQENGENR